MRNVTNGKISRTKIFYSGMRDRQHPTIRGIGNENKLKYDLPNTHQDIAIHKKVIADWEVTHARYRAQQIRDNQCENRSRTAFEYKIRDMVRIITTVRERRGKLVEFERQGFFKVTAVYKMEQTTFEAERLRNELIFVD